MRWDHLFADLEAQAGLADASEREQLLADGVRSAIAAVGVIDRLRLCARQGPINLGLLGGEKLTGELTLVGADWLTMRTPRCEALVPCASLAWLDLAGGRPELSPTAGVESRLTLRHPLRTLARNRVYVWVDLVDGQAVSGTIDRVGADHFELAEHAADEPRRASSVRLLRLVPFRALDAVRSSVQP